MLTFFRILLVLALALVGLVLVAAYIFRDKRPAVYSAAEHGDTNAIAQYLASGSNVNGSFICYKNGHRYASLLHIAVLGDHPDAVDFLVKKGADPNQPDSSGDPPLHLAIGGSGDEALVRILIKAGADPNL